MPRRQFPSFVLLAVCLSFPAERVFAWAEAKAEEKPFVEKPPTAAIVELRVEPAALALTDKFDFRKAIVLGKTADGGWVDLTRVAQFKVPGDVVRRDAEGFFTPLKDGKVEVEIAAGGKTARLPIQVAGAAKDRPISFVRDVMPILSKADCNSGPCHGTPKGKKGFKLSLRGYDPEWDHEQLVDDLSSRRFNRSRPKDSLFLLKPTQQVAHEGGFKFAADSHYYNVLYQWIVEGNLSDVGKTTRAQSISVSPETIVLREPGAAQDLVVIARYADGSTRDVTREAVLASSVDYITKVGPVAQVQGLRRGEAAILIRYEGNYAVKYATVLSDKPGYVWTQTPTNNYIDVLVHKKLQSLKMLPSELCTDEEFLRRVYLDLIGVPPQPEEVRAFLADATPTKEKRDKVVDKLLDRPEYVDRWSHKWADLLQCNRKYLGEKGVWAFRNWIRQAVAADMPIDQFVYQILTASGSSTENPATNFYRIARDPLQAMESSTHLFLGIRFNCNKCHDHPFERWTQNQHYELGAFFAQVGRKPGSIEGEEVVFDRRDAGDAVRHPRTNAEIAARFPYTHDGAVTEPNVKRKMVAQWITSPSNPYFAKSMANRFWSYLMGVGVIEPVDDLRSGNPPSNPELLDALTRDFVEHGFQLKHLLRTIACSRTYQMSIRTNAWNEDDKVNFSHAMPRRLTAEQLQDAISVATGVPVKYPGLPSGFHATQLPDSNIQMEFLDQFGRPPRESVCECERVSEVSLKQALNLINGPTIGDALADPNGRFAKLTAKPPATATLVEEIYLAVLCRRPTAAEQADAAKFFAGAPSPLEGAQDLAWALCNTPAFLFNR